MTPLIYDQLVTWYRLLDPPAEHEAEAGCYGRILMTARPSARSMLELGAGAGHNALFMKRRFACTLTDLAPSMLELSRQLNPECEHALGDMRTLRLGRSFDVVFVHDAVCYMTSEQELLAAMRTAHAHLAPGGVALFVPDADRESFTESTELHELDDGERALRCLTWSWAPDASGCVCLAEYALLLRERGEVKAYYDQHREGLFSRATWSSLLEQAGFRAQLVPRPLHDGGMEHAFLGVKR